jgi:hypothetical protein
MHRSAPQLCGARTRSGAPCRTPVVRDRSRCRMHGGTSPGAPKGNRNAWKHGRYSAEVTAERIQARQTFRGLVALIEAVQKSGSP